MNNNITLFHDDAETSIGTGFVYVFFMYLFNSS